MATAEEDDADGPQGPAAPGCAKETADLPAALYDLRNEYNQIRKAENHVQKQRTKWMRSVEQWLKDQEQVAEAGDRHGLGGNPRSPLRPSRMDASPYSPSEPHDPPESLRHNGPQKPCGPPQPPSDLDDVVVYDSPVPAPKVGDEVDGVDAVGNYQASTYRLRPSIEQEMEKRSAARGMRRSLQSEARGSEATCEAERLVESIELQMPPAKKRLLREQKREFASRAGNELMPRMSRLVGHPMFDSTCALMILFNSVIIGIDVQHKTTHTEETNFNFVSGYICSAFFFIELILRMSVQGVRVFFTNENRNWNLFDTALVLFSIVDMVVTAAQVNAGTAVLGNNVKTIKMMRIVRVFRVFRFFRELSLLAMMIVDSMKALWYALMMLAIIIYVFAIFFTAKATEFLKGNDSELEPLWVEVDRQFGTLDKTIISLLQAMLGGVSWGVCSDPLMKIDVFTGMLFLFYVFFALLAVMNIITGVFVDNAVETARTQREFLIQKEVELKEKLTQDMQEIFGEMDTDGSGTVSLDEIKAYVKDPRVQGYFQALGLDPNDTDRLFKLIDDDGSGDVDVGEFLKGCLRIRGEARSIDVYAIMHDMKNLEKILYDFVNSSDKAEISSMMDFGREMRPPPPPQAVSLTMTTTAVLQEGHSACYTTPAPPPGGAGGGTERY